jgi:hypothetical protein
MNADGTDKPQSVRRLRKFFVTIQEIFNRE